jgi:beta-barrel assembly-enhancing protease
VSRRGIITGAFALALALPGCAALRPLPGGDLLADAAAQNARVMGQNAVRAVASGELSKDATFTMEQEHYVGKTVAASVIARLGGDALAPEHPASLYVRRVGTVVALAAAELRAEDARPWPFAGFRFVPVASAQVNAVGVPGGFVTVTTGLLRAVRTEDELAAVLAHEVAHVALGHPMQPIESARKQERLTGVLLEGTSDVVHAFFGKVVEVGTDVALDRGFGNRNELAADALAARILAEAGYDPAALPAFLGRLEGAAAKGGFLSRHPAPAERIRALGPLPAVFVTAPEARRARLTAAVASLR